MAFKVFRLGGPLSRRERLADIMDRNLEKIRAIRSLARRNVNGKGSKHGCTSPTTHFAHAKSMVECAKIESGREGVLKLALGAKEYMVRRAALSLLDIRRDREIIEEIAKTQDTDWRVRLDAIALLSPDESRKVLEEVSNSTAFLLVAEAASKKLGMQQM